MTTSCDQLVPFKSWTELLKSDGQFLYYYQCARIELHVSGNLTKRFISIWLCCRNNKQNRKHKPVAFPVFFILKNWSILKNLLIIAFVLYRIININPIFQQWWDNLSNRTFSPIGFWWDLRWDEKSHHYSMGFWYLRDNYGEKLRQCLHSGWYDRFWVKSPTKIYKQK